MRCSLISRADNLVLVKFGFRALRGPSFFRRLVLDLVLKTSNSARLVLLKFNKNYAKWWWWARPHFQIHSIERSGQICNIWRDCNTKCCTIWPSGSRSTEACMLFLRSWQAAPCIEMSPWLAVMISVDFELDEVLWTQIPVSTPKLRAVVIRSTDFQISGW